jgi:hypothetical protein
MPYFDYISKEFHLDLFCSTTLSFGELVNKVIIVSNVKKLQFIDYHHMDWDFNSTKFACSHEKKKMISHNNYSGDALILELFLGLVAWKIFLYKYIYYLDWI